MGKWCIYPGTHPGPGVSYVADDPPGSAHLHPNKEYKSKEKEFGRQSGRVVTQWQQTWRRNTVRPLSRDGTRSDVPFDKVPQPKCFWKKRSIDSRCTV
jgi:hypothetical protein